MRAFGWIAAVGVVLAPVGAGAQKKLTLDEALSKAKSEVREIQAARARLDASEAGIAAARAGMLPVLVVTGRYTRNHEESAIGVPIVADTNGDGDLDIAGASKAIITPEEQIDGVVSATVPLLAPSTWSSVSAAKKSFEAAEAATLATETDVLLSVARSFYAAAGADEVLQATTNAVEVAKKTLDDAKARVEAGTRNRVEVTRAELALVRAEQSRLEAGDARERAYRNLATLLQMKEPFQVQAPDTTTAPPASVEELARDASSKRPEIRALRLAADASGAQARAATFRSLPTLSAFGNARLSNYEGLTGDKHAWAVGAQIDWALFDGGARYAAGRSARSQKRDAEIRLSLLEDQVRDEVANARASVDVRRAALESAKRSVTLSKESLDLIRAQTDAGRATQLDLLQSQDALVAAEVQLARARFDLGLADLELKRAVGSFKP